jgi:uncharacterized protein YerC
MSNEYIAGFFDGEGSVTKFAHKNSYRITLPQTNLEVLEKIRLHVGVGAIMTVTKRKAHYKDFWLYYTSSNVDTKIFIDKIVEHLVIKKEKCEIVLNKIEQILKEREYKDERIKQDTIEVKKYIEEGLSYRKIEKILGISRQKICRLSKI